jgi:ATP synthase protein I
MASWEGIAFTLLAGIVLGFAVGYGLDRLFGTLPLFLLLGVFAGFAVALYAVFMETK